MFKTCFRFNSWLSLALIYSGWIFCFLVIRKLIYEIDTEMFVEYNNAHRNTWCRWAVDESVALHSICYVIYNFHDAVCYSGAAESQVGGRPLREKCFRKGIYSQLQITHFISKDYKKLNFKIIITIVKVEVAELIYTSYSEGVYEILGPRNLELQNCGTKRGYWTC